MRFARSARSERCGNYAVFTVERADAGKTVRSATSRSWRRCTSRVRSRSRARRSGDRWRRATRRPFRGPETRTGPACCSSSPCGAPFMPARRHTLIRRGEEGGGGPRHPPIGRATRTLGAWPEVSSVLPRRDRGTSDELGQDREAIHRDLRPMRRGPGFTRHHDH